MQKGSFVTLLAVMYGAAFLAGFNENLMNMALMSIMGEYNVSSVTAQWLVTGFMIVSTLVVTCTAFLFRRIPLRKLFFLGAGLVIVGSALGFVSVNFPMLMVARLIQAAGSGMFIPTMMNTILAVTPRNKLGTFISLGACVITFGPAFAPVVCGALVTAFGWHSIFLVPAIGMIVIAVLGAIFVHDLENTPAKLDAPSVCLSALFLFCLSYGLAEMTITPVFGIASLVVAAAALALFVKRQLSCEHPLINLAPMRLRSFWPATLLVIVSMMGSFSMSVLLPLYFEGACGTTAFFAGAVMLVPILGNAAASMLGGRIMDSKGSWPLIPVGFACLTCGFALMAAFAMSYSLVAAFIACLLAFVGVGLTLSPSQTAGLRTLDPKLNPFGVALMTTLLQVAACIGPSLYVGIMSSAEAGAIAQGAATAAAAAQGFMASIIVAAAISCVGLVISVVYCTAMRKAEATKHAAPLDNANTITSIIESNPYTILETMPVGAVMQQLIERKVSGMPVVNAAGAPVGFLSDGDIMRYLSDRHPNIAGSYGLMEAAMAQSFDESLAQLIAVPAGEICTNGVVSISAQASLQEACNLLAQHKLKKVPVMEGERIVGMLSRSNVLRFTMQRALDSIPQEARA